jgi:hypothetical protein
LVLVPSSEHPLCSAPSASSWRRAPSYAPPTIGRRPVLLESSCRARRRSRGCRCCRYRKRSRRCWARAYSASARSRSRWSVAGPALERPQGRSRRARQLRLRRRRVVRGAG